MGLSKVVFRSLINRPLQDIVDWHLRPRIEERSLPPWEDIQFISCTGTPDQPGARMTVNGKLLGFIRNQIILEYQNYVPGESFEVHQIKGLFKNWTYKMKGRPQGDHACEIIDQFVFSLRFSKFLIPLITRILKKRFMSIIKYKHEVLQNDLDILSKYSYEKPLKILVTGSSGFVGSSLVQFLEFAGHDVWKLTRTQSHRVEKSISLQETSKLEGFDAVFHLAGENVAKGRWNEKKKSVIFTSREQGTQALIKILSSLKSPPKTFICASAVGYYGDRGNEILTEESAPGKGSFLSDVCQAWERAALAFEETGGRVVCTRFGLVLSPHGGVLKQMLLPFKLGMGGRIGDGRQYISWIALDDLIGSLYHILMTPSLSGGVNCMTPYPVSNHRFAKELALALGRWQGPPIPAFFIRLVLGQKGEELLLAGARAEPRKLKQTNFTFHFPKLRQAMQHILPN